MKSQSTKIILSLFIAVALLTAAGGTADAKKKIAPPTYLGKWMRLATYTNGQLVHKEPATLTMMKGSFHSINKYCENAGKLKVSGNIGTMTTATTTCYGHSPGTVTVYTMSFTPDGKQMTIVNTQYGAVVKEVYERIEETGEQKQQ